MHHTMAYAHLRYSQDSSFGPSVGPYTTAAPAPARCGAASCAPLITTARRTPYDIE